MTREDWPLNHSGTHPSGPRPDAEDQATGAHGPDPEQQPDGTAPGGSGAHPDGADPGESGAHPDDKYMPL